MRDDDSGLDENTQPVRPAPERGLGRLGEPLGARVQLSTDGPFAVASVTWRDARGRLFCTLVAKAAYELAPGVCAPLPEPVPIQAEDEPWDEDPSKSIRVPSDLAPFKAAAEVVVVGSAFAPSDRAASSVTARVIVGPVDKAVVAWSPRRFRPDGSIEELPKQTRFPLRWEHAAGGPETDNPAGIDPTRADARGRRSIPEILPAAFEIGRPGDFIPITGLGPIAATWRMRQAYLGEADAAWLRGSRERPAPASFPPRFFQAAQMDQWLDRPLAANERIVLEGLHDSIPRLVTSLLGIEPWAVVGASDEPIRLQGDLLFIDTDRTLATLTFRAQVPLEETAQRVRIVILGVPMGAPPSPDAVRRARETTPQLRLSMAPPAAAPEPVPDLDDWTETTNVELPPGVVAAPLPFAQAAVPPPRPSYSDGALPFAQAAVPPPRPSYPDGALPFAQAAVPPPRASSPDAALPFRSSPAQSLTPPLPAPAPIAPPPVQLAPSPIQLAPSQLAPSPVQLPSPSLSITPSPAPAAPSKPLVTAVKPAPPTAPVPLSAAVGVKAASDAAARADQAAEKKRAAGGAPDKPPPPRRLLVVDLLCFEPKIVPRIRALPRFSAVWTQVARPRVLNVDEPRREPPDRDRADVLRLLCFGRAESVADIRRVLAESLDDGSDLDPPLVLAGGELRPTFDEIETLRTTVAVAQPIAGADKKVLAAIALAQEALGTTIGPRPDAAISLARQIEAATASLSLPARYVAAQAERALLEGRKLKRRTLLGAPRIRADISLGGESLPIYLPDAVAGSLPLLPAFPVIALCEARPREDAGEQQAEALFAVALGRVLHARS